MSGGPLATWLHPLGLDRIESEFFARAMFLEPDAARLDVLGDLASASVDELLANRRSDVVAWFSDREGVHQTARVSPTAARRLHRAGIALYMLDVPELEALSDDVAAELGVPARNVQCTLFCNPAGSHTRAHFDPVHNFTIQLSGRKRWRVAPNRHTVLPTEGWAMLDRTMPPEIALSCHEQLPTTMPDDATEFVLTAGAILSIPRGWWHETASAEPSISLHLHYEPILWVDTVLATLRARLLRERRWRDALPLPVSGVDVDPAAHLEDLARVLGELDPADIVPPPIPQRSTVTRSAGGSLAVIGPVGDTGEIEIEVVSPQPGAARHTSLALTAAPLAAAQRLAATSPTRPLRLADLVDEVPGLDPDDADALVEALLEAGFLRPSEFVTA
jgi:50S ribosomal protein L16 3-hydroxylase